MTDRTPIRCTNDVELARNGDMTVRQVLCEPQWFDVYFGDPDAGGVHIKGTLDFVDALRVAGL